MYELSSVFEAVRWVSIVSLWVIHAPCPIFYHLPPVLQQIGAEVGSLHTADTVGEGGFGDFPRFVVFGARGRRFPVWPPR